MKEYLVDVPVAVFLWVRPELQKKQFEKIREARPSVLFLISDGGRNQKEWDAITENRNMYDTGVDWNCSVYRMYADENRGMYTTVREMYDLIWQKVDRCIFLEDDILPSKSFFTYCADLLEYYKDDTRISMICGMNHVGTWNEEDTDYFFSYRGSIWGHAIWKRTYDLNWNQEYGNNPYIMKTLFHWTKDMKDYRRQVTDYLEKGTHEGHEPGPEFYFKNSFFAQNQLSIIPSKNLISNIGFGNDTAHGDTLDRLPRSVRRLFNMKTYEYERPLRHLKYVIPDTEYEKKHRWITGYGHPILIRMRKLERFFLVLKSGDMKYLKAKLKNKLSKSQIKET